jgi:hypothetical protein
MIDGDCGRYYLDENGSRTRAERKWTGIQLLVYSLAIRAWREWALSAKQPLELRGSGCVIRFGEDCRGGIGVGGVWTARTSCATCTCMWESGKLGLLN